MVKKGLVRIALLLATVSIVAGCAAPAPTATPTPPAAAAATPTPTKAPTATPTKRPLTKATLTYSSPDVAVWLLTWVAQGKGYFREEGLEVDLVDAGSGTKILAAVLGGDSHFGTIATPDVIAAVAQDQPVQTFAVARLGHTIDIVMRKDVAAQKGITEKSPLMDRIKALKGLHIGASSPGAATDYTIRYALGLGGIDPERDVELTYLGTDAARNAALKAGSIDVLSTAITSAYMNVLDEVAIMLVAFSGTDIPEVTRTAGVIAVGRKDRMNSNPELFEAFARAYWRASMLVKDQKNEALEAARKFFPEMDPALSNILFEAARPRVIEGPGLTKEAFEASLAFRNKTFAGPPVTITYDQFYTSKFVDAAKKQLGL
ncbi:MAG: ABC transporter substrate-binding protein [Chloroflexi bacterium]|nr:ABC transporter substrate-binding protein [Chloroflexota bacterium]